MSTTKFHAVIVLQAVGEIEDDAAANRTDIRNSKVQVVPHVCFIESNTQVYANDAKMELGRMVAKQLAHWVANNYQTAADPAEIVNFPMAIDPSKVN